MKSCLQILAIVLLLVAVVDGQNQHPQPEQTAMTLTGVVYDTNGSVIVGTRLSAHGRDGKRYQAATNDEGVYKLQLPLDVYKVEATAPGFCPTVVEGFRVVNATHGRMSLDFVLEVGATHTECTRAIKVKRKPKKRN